MIHQYKDGTTCECEEMHVFKYPDGGIEQETPLIGGQPNGIAKKYSETGELQSIMPFLNGKKHGIKVSYFEDGKVECEIPFENGIQHGLAKYYSETGELKAEAPFVNGKRHGLHKDYFYPQRGGMEITTMNYHEGELMPNSLIVQALVDFPQSWYYQLQSIADQNNFPSLNVLLLEVMETAFKLPREEWMVGNIADWLGKVHSKS